MKLLVFFNFFFFFNDTATTEIYTSSHTLSLHDALPIYGIVSADADVPHLHLARGAGEERRRSEEHTSELQSRELISYAVFCLKKKKLKITSEMNTTIAERTNL